jgi:hypothetical protein
MPGRPVPFGIAGRRSIPTCLPGSLPPASGLVLCFKWHMVLSRFKNPESTVPSSIERRDLTQVMSHASLLVPQLEQLTRPLLSPLPFAPSLFRLSDFVSHIRASPPLILPLYPSLDGWPPLPFSRMPPTKSQCPPQFPRRSLPHMSLIYLTAHHHTCLCPYTRLS